ncbi:MAG: radical SAM protein [Myxococcota bacterium]|nr:radical SAM protein [Myxococcota bacterium]
MMKQSHEDSHQTKGLIRLTMACNERCPFCNVPMEAYQKLTPSQDEVDIQLQRFIDSGEQTLTISGGEPTLLRKRLLRLIQRAKSAGIPIVELQSNAILIDSEYAQELKSAGLTSAFISLLSDLPSIHDELAGLNGAFERCVRGIRALIDQGIRVTLNPVIAKQSQSRIVQYLHFVHHTFPEIQAISLSAVQPHGRAKDNHNLMPEYDRLAESVPKAIETAKSLGIKLLNPYCGLPICIGWTSQTEHCVELIEAEAGGEQKPNILNRGNKSKGNPCQWCVYRTSCGGAWHAYWEHRSGKGIEAPVRMVPPWISVSDNAYQSVRIARDIQACSKMDTCSVPSLWIVVSEIQLSDWSLLQKMRFSDLVWRFDPSGMATNLQRFREKIRTMKSLRKRLMLYDQRLHILCSTTKGSLMDRQTLSQVVERLNINLKIADTLPESMEY